MDPILAGALISAGGNLLGGALNRSASSAVLNKQLNAQGMADLYGLQWRAGDARAAEKASGINALTLLGSQPINFSPVSVGDTSSFGQGVANAGQDLGRAATAMLTKASKADLLNEELTQAKIENVKADTVKILSDASRMAVRNQPGDSPGVVPYNFNLGGPPDPRPHKGTALLEDLYFDPVHKEYVRLPSEKSASPLQTLGAMPVNVGMALRNAYQGIVDHIPGLPDHVSWWPWR